MTGTKIMNRIKAKLINDHLALPALHEKATDLGLCPQPWWNKDFYDHAIRTKERELQARG